MKRIFLVVFLLNFCQIYAQQWTYQPSNTTNNLSKLFFYNNQNGWAAASGGIICKTTDGGANWAPISTGFTTHNFSSIHFYSLTNGFAASNTGGNQGYLFKTINGGLSWTQVSVGSSMTGYLFGKIHFINANIGIAQRLSNIKEIVKTIDGGVTWTSISPYSGPACSYPLNYDIMVVKNNNQIFLSNYYCQNNHFISNDFGASFYKSVFANNCAQPNGFDYYDTTSYLAGSYYGLCTTNGTLNIPTISYCQNINNLSFNNAYATGYGNSNSQIFRILNGGLSFKNMSLPSNVNSVPFSDMFFTDSLNGWAIQDNRIYKYDGTDLSATINDSIFCKNKLYYLRVNTRGNIITGSKFEISLTDGSTSIVINDTTLINGGLQMVPIRIPSNLTFGSFKIIIRSTGNGMSHTLPNNSNPNKSWYYSNPNVSFSFSSNQTLFTSAPFSFQLTGFTSNMNYGQSRIAWNYGDSIYDTTAFSVNQVYHTYLYNGTYSVSGIVLDEGGCNVASYSRTAYIYCSGGQNPCTHQSNIYYTGSLQKCIGDTMHFTCNTNPNFSYQWKLNNVNINGAIFPSLNVTTSGVYQVEIKDGNGCPKLSQTASIVFNTKPPVPAITQSGILTKCVGSQVTLSAPAGFAAYNWSNNSTSQFINVSSPANYYVTVFNQYNCSNISLPYALSYSTIPAAQICIIGVDSASQKNMVVWEKSNLSFMADSFIIYKESSIAGQYSRIGSKGKKEFSTFIDLNSTPNTKTDKYKLAIKDSCGNIWDQGSFHKTVLLAASQSTSNNIVNLNWNAYEGLNIGTYTIYKGYVPKNMMVLTTLAAQTGFNNYNDTSTVFPVYYQIEYLNPNGCSPTAKKGNYAKFKSNIVQYSKPNGISETERLIEPFKLFPNPTNGMVYFSTELKNYNVQVFDVLGKMVITENEPTLLDFNNLPSGLYSIAINNIMITKIMKY